jgi:hypothetical protein
VQLFGQPAANARPAAGDENGVASEIHRIYASKGNFTGNA